MRKNYRKPQICWCRSLQSRKISSFFAQFWPSFSQYLESTKKVQIFIEIIGKYCKNIESIESMKVTTLESNALPFHFAWKATLRPYNSVQAYNSVDCQKHLILMSRGRNSKTTKVAESNLVLGAEFLSTTFSFDLLLVLTIEVFCVALNQNFRIGLFHLEHIVCICMEHLIRK